MNEELNFDLLCWQLTDALLTRLISYGVPVEEMRDLITLKVTQEFSQKMCETIPEWIRLAKEADLAATIQSVAIEPAE